jgi:hypothetical protein
MQCRSGSGGDGEDDDDDDDDGGGGGDDNSFNTCKLSTTTTALTPASCRTCSLKCIPQQIRPTEYLCTA